MLERKIVFLHQWIKRDHARPESLNHGWQFSLDHRNVQARILFRAVWSRKLPSLLTARLHEHLDLNGLHDRSPKVYRESSILLMICQSSCPRYVWEGAGLPSQLRTREARSLT